jgi:hypothetical protein
MGKPRRSRRRRVAKAGAQPRDLSVAFPPPTHHFPLPTNCHPEPGRLPSANGGEGSVVTLRNVTV